MRNDGDAAALRERLLEEDATAATETPPPPPPRPSLPSARAPRRSGGMSAAERLMLSPYEKWVTYGRFPWKILLHALLLALTLAQMLLYEAQNASYMRATHRNWAYFFLPPTGSQDIGITPRFQRELFTVNQTFDAVFFMRDAYFSIANDSVANYEYQADPWKQSSIRPIDMVVTTQRRRRSDSAGQDVRHYRVAQEPRGAVGPFLANATLCHRQKLTQSLVSVAFTFHLRDRQYGDFYDECFDWSIHLSLKMMEGGTQLKAQIQDCEITNCARLSLWNALQQKFVWLHIVITSVTLLYLWLSGRALGRSIKLVAKATARLASQRASSPGSASSSVAGGVPLSLRIQLINRLQLVVFLALLLLLGSSLWSLFFLKAHVPISYWHRALQATAILLLWSSLVGYLEHNRQIYSIVLTLRWGAPRVLQFLIGVSPIFIGFALFGTIYFGPRVKAFGSLSDSMMTLFAVLNGDVILDTFDALDRHQFHTVGKLYLYAFICLFIYVVLNIFIAIVEEAFFATRNCRRLLDVLLTSDRMSSSSSNTAAGSTTGAPGITTARTTTASPHDAADVSSEMVRLLLQLIDEGAQDHKLSNSAAPSQE